MIISEPGISIIEPRILKIMTALDVVNQPMNGRQLSRVTHMPKTQTNIFLNRLVQEGVLKSSLVGRALNYEANSEHFYWQLLTTIKNFDVQFKTKLIEILPPGLRVYNAKSSLFLFGSVARKQATLTSDIDLGIIVPDLKALHETEQRIDRYRPEIEAFTGNELSPFLVPWREFVRMVSNKSPLIASWENESEHLAGDHVADLKTQVLLESNTYNPAADLYA